MEIVNISMDDWRITLALDPIEAHRLAYLLRNCNSILMLPTERNEDLGNHLRDTLAAMLDCAAYALDLSDRWPRPQTFVEWQAQVPAAPPPPEEQPEA